MTLLRTLFAAALLWACGAAPAAAEIALLTNGRTLKVTAWNLEGVLAELTLSSGGKILLPAERVERIIEDEIAPPQEVEEAENLFPDRAWRFDESSRPLFGSRYDDLILAAARKFDVDAALVSAVIKVESDYQNTIVSHKGARGLMQLMPATAKRFGVTNPFDPNANIHAGARYLRWLLDHFDGNVELALAGYNAGEGNVRKYRGVPPFRETVNYVRKIARILDPPQV